MMFALWAGHVLLEWGFPSQRAAIDCALRVMPFLPVGTVISVEHWLGMDPVETDTSVLRALTDTTPIQAHIIPAHPGDAETVIMDADIVREHHFHI